MYTVTMAINNIFASCRQNAFENGLKGYLHQWKFEPRTHSKDMEKKLLSSPKWQILENFFEYFSAVVEIQ